jgi:polyhydroxybutyrate depolymerase
VFRVGAFLLLAACGLPLAPSTGSVPPGDFTVRVRHDGRSRRYLLHVPADGRATPRPLVVVLHGAAGDAMENRAWVGLDELADREGFLAVYPDGTGPFRGRVHMWNAGTCCGSAQWEAVDDVGFLLAVLDDVERRTAVDPTRVYVAGFSNGAMMAYRLAAEASDRIAAIAAVAGARPAELGTAVRAMPVMHVHSLDDRIVPFAGGERPILPFVYSIPLPAVEPIVRAWALHAGCPETPAESPPRPAPADGPYAGHWARQTTWGPCADGVEIVLWRLHGPGHVWPGPPATLRSWFVGPATAVIDVREEMWRFFRRFQRMETGVRADAAAERREAASSSRRSEAKRRPRPGNPRHRRVMRPAT